MPKNKNLNQLEKMRHSCAHVLAAAVLKLWPKIKLGIGPVIENGFYYDFDFQKSITDSDLQKIFTSMIRIIEVNLPFSHEEISVVKAKELFKNQPYKLELVRDLQKEDNRKISLYHLGDVFTDLCAGPHLKQTREIGPFKLLSIAGAYWRGDEKNKMLTRIYGTCWSTKKQLDHYLWQLEEAKKRDHKKLGPQLDIFHFQAEAPGMPFWHPNGMVIRNTLLEFSRTIQQKYGYLEVQAPNLLSVDIFKKSGHFDHYKENMFFTKGWGNRQYALRPMDCPGTIQIYKFKKHSYKELPLRLAEYGTVTRNEKSGELNGLLRVAQITQDDAHLFIRHEQIQQIVEEIMQLTEEIYQVFRMPYKVYLSTRPDDFMGRIETWNKAEVALKKALEAHNLPLLIKEKEGAFYGPKIDYQLEDSLGRTWQCATIQLDFQMPQVFDLTYVGKEGKEHRPVMIHRTIMGSIERFIAILIEHFAGAFPVWLAPVQTTILPIANRHHQYAQTIMDKLKDENVRVELDDRTETLSAKIRDAQIEKVPYMLVIGDKEVKSKSVAVRRRDEKDLGKMKIDKFIKLIKKEIKTRK